MAHEHSRGFGLLQLRVLGFGLLVDRDVGIGVFPEGEEILIRGAGFVAGDRIGLSFERIRARESKASQRSPGEVGDQSVVVDELLELRCRGLAVVPHEIRLAAHISRAKIYIDPALVRR